MTAPKLEWRWVGDSLCAFAGTAEVGRVLLLNGGPFWYCEFLNESDDYNHAGHAEAIEWVETQWLEFWTKIHETPYEGEDGS